MRSKGKDRKSARLKGLVVFFIVLALIVQMTAIPAFAADGKQPQALGDDAQTAGLENVDSLATPATEGESVLGGGTQEGPVATPQPAEPSGGVPEPSGSAEPSEAPTAAPSATLEPSDAPPESPSVTRNLRMHLQKTPPVREPSASPSVEPSGTAEPSASPSVEPSEIAEPAGQPSPTRRTYNICCRKRWLRRWQALWISRLTLPIRGCSPIQNMDHIHGDGYDL